MRRSVLVATFEDEKAFVDAADAVARQQYRIHDAYGPYPVHHLEEALGIRGSKLPWVTLGAGVAGMLIALGFQFYAAVLDWPMNIGGKPDNSTLAFIPITFELTVLLAGLATVGALLFRCRLFPRLNSKPIADRVTEDRFALVLRKGDPSFDWSHVRRLLQEHGAAEVHVSEVER